MSNSWKDDNKKIKKFIILLSILVIISCKAQPQYYQDKVTSHLEVAYLYLAEGRYTDALRELELAKKTDKCDAQTYNLLGFVYMMKKDFAKAEENFLEALKLDPNFSEAYNNLGSLRVLQERYQEAIEYFQRALSNPLYVNSHLALTNMGWAYYQLGDKERAFNYLHSALKENPRAIKALINLALIYLNEGDLDSAEFYLKRALKSDRSSLEARYYLGEVHFRKGNFELAKEIWTGITDLAPESEWSRLAEDKLYLLMRLQKSKP